MADLPGVATATFFWLYLSLPALIKRWSRSGWGWPCSPGPALLSRLLILHRTVGVEGWSADGSAVVSWNSACGFGPGSH